ncbi:MAG: DNA repair protein RecN [Deltaproteobacteria bacterium]|jgi:DNA repair protein RecN (Recombination protein N)|nr:DNA repair protein RecN [Deltaproteobacteria bacterium]
MLNELQVKNLALIESLNLSFGPGANLLTGETGAGKSILAGALGLIRGGKASAELIRTGAKELTVEAFFTLTHPETFRPLFEAQGITPADEIILKRVIYPNGRSRAYLNGSFITITHLSQWGEELLVISSQYDQQSLLNPSKQLEYLDAFGHYADLLLNMEKNYRAKETLKNSLQAVEKALHSLTEQKDFLEFQLQEIQKVAPRPEEDQELFEIKNRSKENARLSSIIKDALHDLYGDGGILAKTDKLKSLLNKGSTIFEPLGGFSEHLETLNTVLGELCTDLKNTEKNLGRDHFDLDQIEMRLSDLSRLKRKYGPTLEEVLTREHSLKDSLTRLEQLGLDQKDLRKKLTEAEKQAGEAATQLHQARVRAASELQRILCETLSVLGFPKVEFKIAVSLPPLNPEGEAQGFAPLGRESTAKGADTVVFLFCPNPGEGLKPLSKIASGGELSRVTLALKTALESNPDQSLVFDEIDSGLSGATAEAVASKMAELSKSRQVFVITHQPLMAAIPGKHFLAAKSPERGRTFTSIQELALQARAAELARMLDGASPSQEAQALSKRLLGL